MLLEFKSLFDRYSLDVKGVIQVGAHWGQEYEYYKKCGISDMIFIEPIGSTFKVLKDKMNNTNGVILFNCACSDFEGSSKMYVDTTNAGMSSSLLKPKEHLVKHPDIHFENVELVAVRKLDNLPFTRDRYNLLVMDVQGGELNVLKGAESTLPYIDVIYTEVNELELYEDCVLIESLDNHLKDFERVATYMVPGKGWGDALYLRR